MKRLVFDILLIMIGILLTPWAIHEWSEIGFRLEPKFYAGNRDGSFFLIMTMLGIGMILSGLFNIFVLRHGRKNHQ